MFGEPVVLPGGYEGQKYIFDSSDKSYKETVNIDRNGRIIVTDLGYSIVRQEYNNNSQVIKQKYLGLHHDSVNTICGFSTKEIIYDGAGRIWKICFYDAEEVPLALAQIQFGYDENDYIEKLICCDEKGHRIETDEGIAYAELTYNSIGKLIDVKYFNLKEQEIDYKVGKYKDLLIWTNMDYTAEEVNNNSSKELVK